MGKSKDAEKRLAYIYYVEKYKTAKDSAVLANVTEKTLNDWIKNNGWKKLRDAKLNSSKNQVDQIKELIGLLTKRRLDTEAVIADVMKSKSVDQTARLEELRSQCIGIGDEVSKWNKTLENLDRANRINLGVYMEVMEDVFMQMQISNPDLHMKTLDFQQELLQQISLKY